MSIGSKIKERRIALNMSVDDLAYKANKNKATIYRYEKGDIENLPITVLQPIAHALHTTPQYLMGWEDDPIDYETWAEENSPPKDFLSDEADTFERARAWYKVVNESDYYGEHECKPQTGSLDILSRRLNNERKEFAIKFLEALCNLDDKKYKKIKTIIELSLEME